ncbi:hypothetical protein OJ998_24325 [Solirubrobacter taibaiensis]|nr:hypothetical protein [Solirubrobacter taibaiensis]
MTRGAGVRALPPAPGRAGASRPECDAAELLERGVSGAAGRAERR